MSYIYYCSDNVGYIEKTLGRYNNTQKVQMQNTAKYLVDPFLATVNPLCRSCPYYFEKESLDNV